MGSREQIESNDNPEESAITGGAPPSAEPPPFTRGRRSSAVASAWIYVAGGLVLILAALLGDQESERVIGTAVAGLGLLILGGASMAGLVDPVTRAILGFVAGVLLTVIAFATITDFGVGDLMLLGVGAASFIASFASLAASRRLGSDADDDEPGVGVGNV